MALREAATPDFRTYAHQVVANARALAEALIERGFTLVSGGTDNHLILIDLTNKGSAASRPRRRWTGPGIECNYNTVPYDPRKPFDPSGHPARHRRADHPRAHRGADAAGGRLDRRGGSGGDPAG